jgi:hypothetical protein
MKDIGYYAGFLKLETQEAIRNAPLWKLCTTLGAYGEHFADEFYYLDESIQEEWLTLVDFPESEMSDRNKLALIRGLCDAIELKLMEAAK